MSASGARLCFYPDNPGEKRQRLPTNSGSSVLFWLTADVVCGRCDRDVHPPELETQCRYCEAPLFTSEEAAAILSMILLGTTIDQLEAM